ncbi:hypothetical protein GY21_07355 [Cryobacterium roopkundense]|uniref:Uncharacterized protein n=1 Tax=Cryobacterium roopkundense TaxID=1001240 RepID=A0A099JJE2_9MICO|nr:hypothetical protein [Cryobacterium roopkundense]KGJ77583.1 hypothetical protein GY21_07355 [Cryobacterium roopkundense]MBB5641701.1 hypothetical protein [Cryobacterium roopkundense]
MCGACGSTVYPDPVMGDEQTLRKRMLVAHTVNSLTTGVPGTPRTTALAGGWTVTGPTGATTLCHTVADIWTAVLAGGLPRLLQQLEARAVTDEPGSLAAQVTDVGLRLARHRLLQSYPSNNTIGS